MPENPVITLGKHTNEFLAAELGSSGFFEENSIRIRSVIDNKKIYVTLVMLDEKGIPKWYTLKKGETLLEALPPGGKVKPRWNGKEWEETATPEEIEAAEKARYESDGFVWPPEPPAPSENEYLLESVLDLDFRTTMLELGL